MTVSNFKYFYSLQDFLKNCPLNFCLNRTLDKGYNYIIIDYSIVESCVFFVGVGVWLVFLGIITFYSCTFKNTASMSVFLESECFCFYIK